MQRLLRISLEIIIMTQNLTELSCAGLNQEEGQGSDKDIRFLNETVQAQDKQTADKREGPKAEQP